MGWSTLFGWMGRRDNTKNIGTAPSDVPTGKAAIGPDGQPLANADRTTTGTQRATDRGQTSDLPTAPPPIGTSAADSAALKQAQQARDKQRLKAAQPLLGTAGAPKSTAPASVRPTTLIGGNY